MSQGLNRLLILTLLLLATTTTLSNVAIVTSLPHLKEYFTDIKNIEFYARLMLTLPSLVIALLAPFLGHLIFKVGKKRSAIVALFGFSLFGTAGLYLQSLEWLLFSRAMFGISVASLMIVSTSFIGDYFQGPARHKFMGYQSAFMAIGAVGFVIGGGVLSDINWRYTFGIYFIGLVILPLIITQIQEKKHFEQEEEEGEHQKRKLQFIFVLSFFYMLIFFSLPTQIPFLLIEQFGASGKLTGTIIALAFLCNGLGAISFPRLKRYFSYGKIYLIASSIIAFGFIGVGIVNHIYLFFLAGPLLGFGGGIMMTNVTAWMLSLSSSEKRVKSSGYFTSSLFLGQFASPLVFHPLVSYVGVQDFFLIVGVSLLLISLFSTFIQKTD